MIYLDKNNKNQILTFIPLIKDNYADWHIVSISFDAKDKLEAEDIIQDFLQANEETDGFCYIESEKKAISIMKLGRVDNYSNIKNHIEENLDGKKCKVLAKKMSANGLKQIQINLSSKSKGDSNNFLFEDREKRKNNIILIADDDMFIRKSLVSLLSEYGDVFEVETGDDVVPHYVRYNPDIAILDIHMPGKDGLSLITDLHEQDSNAFVLVSSSDSVKENVLQAINSGAVGFLTKPVQKEKLEKYIDQCITFRKEEENGTEKHTFSG